MALKFQPPVKPLLEETDITSHEKRFQAYLKLEDKKSGASVSLEQTIANKIEPYIDVTRRSQGEMVFNRLHKRNEFVIEELLYPGDQTVAPIDQYVYGFDYSDGGLLIIEALCKGAGPNAVNNFLPKVEWYYRVEDSNDPNFEKPLTPKTKGVKKAYGLLPVPNLRESAKIGFFLSPIPLTLEAQKFVSDNLGSSGQKDHGCSVRPFWGGPWGYVAISEPMKWSEAAHDDWFMSVLAHYLEWCAEVEADSFVASVLESWRKPMKLDGELYTSDTIKTVNAEKEKGQEKHDKALSTSVQYIIINYTSHAHKAINLAAWQSMDTLLSIIGHWSHILRGITATNQGKIFVYQLSQGIGVVKDSLLHQLIKKDLPFSFEENRYLALALHDAAVIFLPFTGIGTKTSMGFVKRMKTYLDSFTLNLPIPYSLKLTEPRPEHWRNRVDDIRSGKMVSSGFLLLELFSLENAANDWKKATNEGNREWVDNLKLLGAAGDFSTALLETIKSVMKAEDNWLGRTGGAFLIAGAFGDAADFGAKAGEAYAEDDMSVFFGASLAASGTTATGIAGLSLLVGLSAETFLILAAPYLLAIGAVAICIGSLIVWFKDSPYEKFVDRGRFGGKYFIRQCDRGHYHNKNVSVLNVPWAHHPLGTQDREDEMVNLIGMMCAFSMSIQGSKYTPSYLSILPGYFPPNAKYEIDLTFALIYITPVGKIDIKAKNIDKNLDFKYKIDLMKDNAHGIIKRIDIALYKLPSFSSPIPIPITSARSRLIIKVNKFQVPAPNYTWLEVRMRDEKLITVNSFQDENYRRF